MKCLNSNILFYVAISFLLTTACSKDDGTTDDNTSQEFTGEVEWIKTFGGSDIDNALSVAETTDGGYAVAGYTQSINGDIKDKTATDSDFFLLKLTKAGDVSWMKTYGGSGDDRAAKVIQTEDNGFVMVGYNRSNDQDVSSNEGLRDYWVVKLDNSGQIQWEKSFGFPGLDEAFSVIQTKDKGYFITGYLDVTASEGGGNDDGKKHQKNDLKHGVGEFWGIKLNASGEREWRRYFGGTNNDRSYGVVQTEDEGFLMIGSSESEDFNISDPRGSYDFWIVKVGKQGELIWEKSYGGTEIDVAYAITDNGNNTYTIVGDSRSSDTDITNFKGNADLWIIQIDAAGKLLWQKSLGGSQFDTGRGICTMKNGNLFITGNSRSNDIDLTTNKGETDLWSLVMDTQGQLLWSDTLGGSKSDFGESCIQTSDGKIIVVGNSNSFDLDISSNRGSKDILVVKYK